jgi:CHAD domain-containing protein/transposase-like protein
MPGHLLTPEERSRLENLVNETGEVGDANLRRRLQVLLLYDEGQATRDVAREAGLSRGRSRYWRRQFQRRGVAAITHEDKPVNLATRPESAGPSETGGAKAPGDDGSLAPAATSERIEAPPVETRPAGLADFAAAAKTLSSPGVQADDPLAEAGRKVWRYHFAQMLLHEEGTLLGEDIEELHDMRVATRRMRAAFDVFSGAFAPKALKRHLRGLRRTGRTLGRVRDLDVFIDKARRYQASLPEGQQSDLEPLLEAWGQDREDARQEMSAYLLSARYLAFKEKFFDFVSTPGAGALPRTEAMPVPYLVREAAPVLIYNRLAAVRGFDAILEQASLDQFHALRIEFKKLRYTLEYFREVLGDEAKGIINEIKGLQDHLGDLNDARVAAELLRDFLPRWDAIQAALPVAERRGPEPILDYLASRYAERQRLMLSFKDAWRRFNRPELREKLAMAVGVL